MNAPLWTGEALLAATGGRAVGTMPEAIAGLSIDSRSLAPNEAFFAIKGDRFDGHDFLTAATGAGAGVLIVSETKLPALGKSVTPLIVVDDVLKALERLAIAARARSKARIVAVTGSVGKTTTKEALRHALAPCGSVHASSASFNNHWGVPLSLARLPPETRFAVFEIGMNHPGEIRPLVKMVRPHVAIVTLIAAAHLGFFKDLGEIAQAKAEIFEGVEPGGTAVVNGDDPHAGFLVRAAREAGVARVATFGSAAGTDFRLLDFSPTADGGRLKASIDGSVVDVRLGVAGRHIAQNVLAVLGAADLSGCDVGAAAAALESWRSGRGRGARHEAPVSGGTITLIDESYNANPASMRASIAVLASTEPSGEGRRIAILGDMLELGEHSAGLHKELAGPLEEGGVEGVILAGPEMKALAAALAGRIEATWHASLGELRSSLATYLRAGDVVMIKASNSIGFSKVVDDLIAARPIPTTAEPLSADAGGASC